MIRVETRGEAQVPAEFLELATTIYQDDHNWIPEDPADIRAAFSAANPWFETGRALICVEPGKARAVGFLSPDYQVGGVPVAFFGYFEAADEPLAVSDVLMQIEDWARAGGAQAVFGPINFSTFGNYRIRTGGFEEPSFQGEPHNPPYYAELLEYAGYSTHETFKYLSFEVDIDSLLTTGAEDYARLKQSIESMFKVQPLTADYWLAHLDQFYELVDEVFKGNFGYTRPSREAFKAGMGEQFANKLCPHSSLVVLDQEGGIAGFFLCFPDYGPLMSQKAGEGRLSRFSFEEAYPRLPEPKTMMLKTVGVRPDCRRHGMSIFLGLEASARAREHYTVVRGALLKSDNVSARYPRRHSPSLRTYNLYRKAI